MCNKLFVLLFFSLYRDSNPVVILKPIELAGISLENRLTSYDWQNQFDAFQRVTRNGSFRQICLDAKNNVVPVSILASTMLFIPLPYVHAQHTPNA